MLRYFERTQDRYNVVVGVGWKFIIDDQHDLDGCTDR